MNELQITKLSKIVKTVAPLTSCIGVSVADLSPVTRKALQDAVDYMLEREKLLIAKKLFSYTPPTWDNCNE